MQKSIIGKKKKKQKYKTASYNANPSTNNTYILVCMKITTHQRRQRPDKCETARIITSLTTRTRLAFPLAAYLKRKQRKHSADRGQGTKRAEREGGKKQRSRKCRINMQWSLGRAAGHGSIRVTKSSRGTFRLETSVLH